MLASKVGPRVPAGAQQLHANTNTPQLGPLCNMQLRCVRVGSDLTIIFQQGHSSYMMGSIVQHAAELFLCRLDNHVPAGAHQLHDRLQGKKCYAVWPRINMGCPPNGLYPPVRGTSAAGGTISVKSHCKCWVPLYAETLVTACNQGCMEMGHVLGVLALWAGRCIAVRVTVAAGEGIISRCRAGVWQWVCCWTAFTGMHLGVRLLLAQLRRAGCQPAAIGPGSLLALPDH